jgi:nucleoid-associated protein YgaU
MIDSTGRIIAACAALAGLWILVYWWWAPSEPRIRFDAERAAEVQQEGDLRVIDPLRSGEARPIAVVPPSFREYTVREGDTLEGIARRELGTARHAEAISRANPYVNFDSIRPGRVIRIPLDPANIQGRPVAGSAAPRPATDGSEGPTAEYTVRPGDTLSRIALSQYGATRYAEMIFEANRDRMRSMNELRVGQKLRLPPRPD